MPDICLRDVVLHTAPGLDLPPGGEDVSVVLGEVEAISGLVQTAESVRPGLETSSVDLALPARLPSLQAPPSHSDQPSHNKILENISVQFD